MKNINETAVADTENVNPNVVIFDTPLMRGEQKVEQVTLTKPNAGTLRGVSLASLANSDVDALIKVLPRIEQRVLEWNCRVLTSSTVASTKYYLALHELFQRYPNSTAMKVGIVDEAELNEALKDAIEFEIVGNRLQKVRKV